MFLDEVDGIVTVKKILNEFQDFILLEIGLVQDRLQTNGQPASLENRSQPTTFYNFEP